jgi:uncharacterized protein YbjQ (UPF0145 family)
MEGDSGIVARAYGTAIRAISRAVLVQQIHQHVSRMRSAPDEDSEGRKSRLSADGSLPATSVAGSLDAAVRPSEVFLDTTAILSASPTGKRPPGAQVPPPLALDPPASTALVAASAPLKAELSDMGTATTTAPVLALMESHGSGSFHRSRSSHGGFGREHSIQRGSSQRASDPKGKLGSLHGRFSGMYPQIKFPVVEELARGVAAGLDSGEAGDAAALLAIAQQVQERASLPDLKAQTMFFNAGSDDRRHRLARRIRSGDDVQLLTMTSFPVTVHVRLGGLVMCRAVKFLRHLRASTSGQERRDRWWGQVRDEIRGHAAQLRCSQVIGYREMAHIYDDIIVLTAIGTAARLTNAARWSHKRFRRRMGRALRALAHKRASPELTSPASSQHMSASPSHLAVAPEDRGATPPTDTLHSALGPPVVEQLTPPVDKAPVEDDSGRTRTHPGREDEKHSRGPHERTLRLRGQRECSFMHVPLLLGGKRAIFNNMRIVACRICRKHWVPEVVLTTCDPPRGLPVVGSGTFIEARVARKRAVRVGEADCVAVGKDLPFAEIDLHEQFAVKLKLMGCNCAFSIRPELVFHSGTLVMTMSGTAFFCEALPPPPPLRIQRSVPTSTPAVLSAEAAVVAFAEGSRKAITRVARAMEIGRRARRAARDAINRRRHLSRGGSRLSPRTKPALLDYELDPVDSPAAAAVALARQTSDMDFPPLMTGRQVSAPEPRASALALPAYKAPPLHSALSAPGDSIETGRSGRLRAPEWTGGLLERDSKSHPWAQPFDPAPPVLSERDRRALLYSSSSSSSEEDGGNAHDDDMSHASDSEDSEDSSGSDDSRDAAEADNKKAYVVAIDDERDEEKLMALGERREPPGLRLLTCEIPPDKDYQCYMSSRTRPFAFLLRFRLDDIAEEVEASTRELTSSAGIDGTSHRSKMGAVAIPGVGAATGPDIMGDGPIREASASLRAVIDACMRRAYGFVCLRARHLTPCTVACLRTQFDLPDSLTLDVLVSGVVIVDIGRWIEDRVMPHAQMLREGGALPSNAPLEWSPPALAAPSVISATAERMLEHNDAVETMTLGDSIKRLGMAVTVRQGGNHRTSSAPLLDEHSDLASVGGPSVVHLEAANEDEDDEDDDAVEDDSSSKAGGHSKSASSPDMRPKRAQEAPMESPVSVIDRPPWATPGKQRLGAFPLLTNEPIQAVMDDIDAASRWDTALTSSLRVATAMTMEAMRLPLEQPVADEEGNLITPREDRSVSRLLDTVPETPSSTSRSPQNESAAALAASTGTAEDLEATLQAAAMVASTVSNTVRLRTPVASPGEPAALARGSSSTTERGRTSADSASLMALKSAIQRQDSHGVAVALIPALPPLDAGVPWSATADVGVAEDAASASGEAAVDGATLLGVCPDVLTCPLTHVPGCKLRSYKGRVSLHFIRESSNVREMGGTLAFLQLILGEASAVARAHAKSVGANAVVGYRVNLRESTDRSRRNQAYHVISVSGDAVLVEAE